MGYFESINIDSADSMTDLFQTLEDDAREFSTPFPNFGFVLDDVKPKEPPPLPTEFETVCHPLPRLISTTLSGNQPLTLSVSAP